MLRVLFLLWLLGWATLGLYSLFLWLGWSSYTVFLAWGITLPAYWFLVNKVPFVKTYVDKALAPRVKVRGSWRWYLLQVGIIFFILCYWSATWDSPKPMPVGWVIIFGVFVSFVVTWAIGRVADLLRRFLIRPVKLPQVPTTRPRP